MSSRPDDIILEMLRAIKADMSATREDLRALRLQATELQRSLTAMRRDRANA